ncbi:MAG: hypothetical protein AAFQ68_24530 [Bacteroidota bacterium]
MTKLKVAGFALYVCLLIGACMNTPEIPPNPFEAAQETDRPIEDSAEVSRLPLSHIVALHQKVFQPTCANSGCHDGTFEPDFRTVESTYNTLVYQPVIKNDPQESFRYRVKPNALEESVLWERLTRDIDGQSGIMPLSSAPDSDWEKNKDSLLTAIRTWIEAGAPDMFGNLPEVENLPPSVKGVFGIIPNHRDPIRREGGNGKMLIPPGTDHLELYLSLQDEAIASQDIRSVKVRFSQDRNDFVNASGEAVEIIPSPIVSFGFTGRFEEYYHHLSIPLDSLVLGDYQYFRVYVQVPGQNTLVEIPSNGSADYMKEMFAFEIHD